MNSFVWGGEGEGEGEREGARRRGEEKRGVIYTSKFEYFLAETV